MGQIGFLEIVNGIAGMMKVCEGFSRVVIRGVTFPMDFIKRFLSHHFVVNDVVDFIFGRVVDEDGGRQGMSCFLRNGGRRLVGSKEIFVKDGMEPRPSRRKS